MLYRNNYDKFLQKIDVNKTKSIIKLCLIVNSAHPLSDINLHWYYNPVTDLFEPTIREAWAHYLPDNNFTDLENLFTLSEENKLLSDFLNDKLIKEILSELVTESIEIDQIIDNDEDYNQLKKSMIGFISEIEDREQIIKTNLNLIQSLKNKISDSENIVIKRKN